MLRLRSVIRLLALPLVLIPTLSAEMKIMGIDENGPPPVFLPAEERGTAFRPDERFEFHGGWGIFSNIARITVTTSWENSPDSGAPEDAGDKEVFLISSLASTNGVIRPFYPADTVTRTYLDANDWTLLSSHFEGRTGKEDNDSTTLIDYPDNLIRHTDLIIPEKSYVYPLPLKPVLDYMSAVFQLRGLPMEIGKTYPIFVQGGGDFYLVQVTVTGTETIKTAMGKLPCFVLEPSMNVPTGIFARGGGVKLWITEHESRLPVRADVNLGFGTARLRLDRYEAPGVAYGKARRK